MASPGTLVDAIALELDSSEVVPDSVTYLTQRADTSGSDSNVKLPVVEIQTISTIDLNEFTTDKVKVLKDASGNSVGRRYHSEFELDLQIDIWVAEGSSHDVDEIGRAIRSTLYMHDSAGPAEPVRVDFDGDGQQTKLDSIWRFKVLDGERADDLSMTPSVRRWRQDIAIWSYEAFDTNADYITDVHYPQPGTLSEDGDVITG